MTNMHLAILQVGLGQHSAFNKKLPALIPSCVFLDHWCIISAFFAGAGMPACAQLASHWKPLLLSTCRPRPAAFSSRQHVATRQRFSSISAAISQRQSMQPHAVRAASERTYNSFDLQPIAARAAAVDSSQKARCSI
jgi:hypothetical protein